MTSKPTARTTTRMRLTDAPLRGVLGSIPLAEAVEQLHNLDGTYSVIPDGYHATLDATIDTITAAAVDLGLTHAADLVEHIELLLRHLVPVGKIAASVPTDIAEPLHTYRNTAAALILVAASVSPHSDRALAAIPQLAARSTALDRPFTDDEILLLRVDAATAHESVRAAVYALADTGLVHHEISLVTPDHLDEPRDPWAIIAPGTKNLVSRHRALDAFGNRVLDAALAHHRGRAERSDTTSLTYQPRTGKPGTAASAASSQQVLDRRIKLAGLDNTDVSASSIAKWRISTVFVNQGPAAAREAYGVADPARTDRVVNFIGARPSAATTRKPLVATFTR